MFCLDCMEGTLTFKWVGRTPTWQCNMIFCGNVFCYNGANVFDEVLRDFRRTSTEFDFFEYRGYIKQGVVT